MKRSEMIELIAEELLELYGGDTEEWEAARKLSNFARARMARKALKAIEKAGMLPPAKQVDIANGRILHYYIQDSLENNEVLSEVEEEWDYVVKDTSILWEPEDD